MAHAYNATKRVVVLNGTFNECVALGVNETNNIAVFIDDDIAGATVAFGHETVHVTFDNPETRIPEGFKASFVLIDTKERRADDQIIGIANTHPSYEDEPGEVFLFS